MTELIYCCGCLKKITCKLVTGKEIYPHRADLYKLPFWQCPDCNNYVGCHHKTNNPTRPLGVIPTANLRAYRSNIHRVLDPLWKRKLISRGKLYSLLSKELGYTYHTGNTRSIEEVNEILDAIIRIKRKLTEDV